MYTHNATIRPALFFECICCTRFLKPQLEKRSNPLASLAGG